MFSRYHFIHLIWTIMFIAITTQVINKHLTYAEESNFDCANVSQIPQNECEALVAIYNSTNGDSWTNNSGWLVTSTPCSWYGVGCIDGSVSGLGLFDNQLTGRIPDEIGNLSQLEVLWLSSNDLTGSLPVGLGNLVNLRTFLLTDAQISGNIPSELGNLESLETLYLWNNQLTGSIPPSLGNLVSLKGLGLGGNNLRGAIPSELGNLLNIEGLTIDQNPFLNGNIPMSFIQLSNLTTFAFHTTGLCEPIDPLFQNWLSNIQYVSSTGVLCGQTGSTPIVFLPGIMGSYLYNFPECYDRPSGEIWPNLSGSLNPITYNRKMTTLHLDTSGEQPANQCDRIRATAIIDEVGIGGLYHRDFYREFLDDLKNYYNQIVWEFPYDWRLDMEAIALQLDEFIESEVKPASGAESVILIGHSLGGLVSRQYTLDQTRAQKVAAVISVGTPYWGAPKAARHMREGTFPIDLLSLVTYNDWVRAGHRNSPALMQILPSEKYFQQVGPYFRKNGVLLGTYDQTDTFFKENGQNSYLLNQAKIRHVFIDNFVHYLFVPHYILAADHKWTISGVHERSCWLGTCWANIELLRGDETVPTQSATLSGSDGDLSGNAQVCLYDGNWVSKGHSELLGEGVIIHDVGSILNGNANWCTPERVMSSAQSQDDSVFEVTVWGESLVTVQDALGNYTGPSEEGLIVNQVPLATYNLGVNSVNVLLPASGAYTITIQQKSAEPIQVDVTDFRSFLSPDAFNRYEAALFMNVPSQTEGVATLLLDPTEDMEELRLALDLDNDGTPDHVMPPTSVLDAGGLQDMTPPTTIITIEGTVNAWGFYTGMVTATVSATDEGTGVLMSEYSVDGGHTWQTYSEPLSFLAEQVPILEARSVDQAGNQEYPWAWVRLQPYAVYLPAIQR